MKSGSSFSDQTSSLEHNRRCISLIWQEFEDGVTDDAKFAKSMDRFEPLLQNVSNNGGTGKEFDVQYAKVYDKRKAIKEGSTTIWAYAENLINESVDKGILKK